MVVAELQSASALRGFEEHPSSGIVVTEPTRKDDVRRWGDGGEEKRQNFCPSGTTEICSGASM